MNLPIYMDNHSTTPLDPRVLEAMMPFLTREFGNASSSSHVFGWHAREAVEKARRQVAVLIGASQDENEIVFTGGATESVNLALRGAMTAYAAKGDHIVTQVTEHKAVLDVCRALEKEGKKVTYLPVDSGGRIRPEDLAKAITERTVLVSLMHANNEIGTIQPIAEAGKIIRERGVLFHVDAAQTVGKIPVNVKNMNIDLLSLSSHKLYGPKGVGALYVRSKNPRVKLHPLILGGGHEHGVRSGTLNVAGIVGLGAACEFCRTEMDSEWQRIGKMRDRLQEGLRKELDDAEVNGDTGNRLYNNLNMSFPYVESESLLMSLGDHIAVSSGSACSSGSVQASHVLKALGLPGQRAHSAIRFGLGRFNIEEEIDYAIREVTAAVKKIRAVSPLYPKKNS